MSINVQCSQCQNDSKFKLWEGNGTIVLRCTQCEGSFLKLKLAQYVFDIEKDKRKEG